MRSMPSQFSQPPVQPDYEQLDTLLSTHFAKFSVQMIELASICLGVVMVLAIIVVIAVLA
jgi:hypothetical protein